MWSLRIAALASAVICGMSAIAQAQTQAPQPNAVQLFNPTPGPRGFFSREYGEVGAHLEPYVALWLNYAKAPLVRYRLLPDGTTEPNPREVIAHQLQVDVVGAIALFNIVELGVGIPFIPFQSGEGLPPTPTQPAQALATVNFGDLRLQPKVSFLNTQHVHMGAAVMLTFPTGNRSSFAGEQTVTGIPRLMMNLRFIDDRLNFGIDAGVRLRGEARLDNIIFGHELVWGGHLSWDFIKDRLTGGIEIYGAMGFPKQRPDRTIRIVLEEVPIDAVAGVKVRAGWFLISLGAGTGITTGYGAPQVRILAGLAFSPQRKKEVAPPPPPPEPAPAPAPPPPPPPPPPVEPKVEITREKIAINDKVYFEFDSDEINPLSFPLLDKVADVIVKNPRLKRVRVDGHTDNVGSDAYNMNLSGRRAKSVLKYLVGHSVEGERLRSEGHGFRKPKTSNASARGRAINRRVEFIIELQELDPAEVVPEKPSFSEDAAIRESPQ